MIKDMTEMKRIIREDYERKVKKFEKMCDQDKTIIIGDSMVAYFNLNTFGLVDQMINQGIAGDTTLGVLDRLYLITKLNPKKVIVSVGSNDMILTDLTLDETVKNILTIKKEIESNAKTKVYIMSLTPVLRDSHVTNHDYVLWRTNKEIEYINNQLKKELKPNEYLPIYDHLLDVHGDLDLKYTTDGIHLNHEGYKRYTKIIKGVIE